MTGNALRLARSVRCALPALCPASGAGRPAGLCSPLLSLSLSLSLTDSLSRSLSGVQLRFDPALSPPCLQRQRRLVSTALRRLMLLFSEIACVIRRLIGRF